jgi:predicted acylesterase/phospholipase RssA
MTRRILVLLDRLAALKSTVPVHIITFDLHSGEDVRLSHEPAIAAVAAAAAAPGVFPRVAWEERLLVDDPRHPSPSRRKPNGRRPSPMG